MENASLRFEVKIQVYRKSGIRNPESEITWFHCRAINIAPLRGLETARLFSATVVRPFGAWNPPVYFRLP
jgi:hypothetical protein